MFRFKFTPMAGDMMAEAPAPKKEIDYSKLMAFMPRAGVTFNVLQPTTGIQDGLTLRTTTSTRLPSGTTTPTTKEILAAKKRREAEAAADAAAAAARQADEAAAAAATKEAAEAAEAEATRLKAEADAAAADAQAAADEEAAARAEDEANQSSGGGSSPGSDQGSGSGTDYNYPGGGEGEQPITLDPIEVNTGVVLPTAPAKAGGIAINTNTVLIGAGIGLVAYLLMRKKR
jgi:hypothetical protein